MAKLRDDVRTVPGGVGRINDHVCSQIKMCRTTSEWQWGIIDKICRATPHLQGNRRAHHARHVKQRGAERIFFFFFLNPRYYKPHKPHDDAVKVFAVEVRANLIIIQSVYF